MNTQDTEQTDATGDVERCPTCQAPVVPIAYGFPGPEMFEVAERGEIILGGCTIVTGNPTHSCPCGATRRGDVDPIGEPARQGEPAEAFSLKEARTYIESVRWQFAKTMPKWPHEYTVREWRPDLTDTFETFATFIRSEGIVKPWPADSATPRYHHRYLAIDGWDYWIMDGTIEDTEVINRARLDDTWQ